MINWNKIGQYIATSASAALLASFATLATPKTASAATLSFDESTQQWVSDNAAEAVSQIMNLDIGGDLFNVTIGQKDTETIFAEQSLGIGSFGYKDSGSPEEAASAIIQALGDSFFTTTPPRVQDQFKVAVSFDPFRSFSNFYQFNYYGDPLFRIAEDRSPGLIGQVVNELTFDAFDYVASFERVGGSGQEVSTPEPSLIFGFITLGGLMLGRKIKNKS